MNLEEILEEIGERLRRAREKKNLSQEELAKLIGSRQNAISTYENGRTNLSISRLHELANTLDVSVFHLLGINDKDAELDGIYQQLSDDNKTIALEIVRLLYRLQQRGDE